MPSPWISALRLRTLPLALACVGMGGVVSYDLHPFPWLIFGLVALTAIFLQLLSNLANDLGDSVHGADSVDRIGPTRTVQSGAISKGAMKRAVWLFVLLSAVSGGMLLYLAAPIQEVLITLSVLAVLSILAALGYTLGKTPYGYLGLGDIFVFVFFGLVSVWGTATILYNEFQFLTLLPGAAMGCFAVGVLNLNNLRDRESDEKAGKHTMVVRLGDEGGRFYHLMLQLVGWLMLILYAQFADWMGWDWLFLLAFPLFAYNCYLVLIKKLPPQQLDPLLKQLALSTLLVTVLSLLGRLI